MTTNLAKSLHTVSALANVARYLATTSALPIASLADASEWIDRAAIALGVADLADTYTLRAQAALRLYRESKWGAP